MNENTKKLNLIFDNEKCIGCGLCAKECSVGCIKLNDKNMPQINPSNETFCIKCQHCFAVCPKGAITFEGKTSESAEPVQKFEHSTELLNLIKSRRSIRNYKRANIDKEKFDKLKNMLPWIPTGCNDHRLNFTLIDDIEAMDKIRNYTNNKLQKLLKKAKLKGALGFSRDSIIAGQDVVFRNAPHMIVVSEHKDAPCVAIDPTIALSYFELYAQSLGIGTLWCGFAEICFRLFPELCDTLEIPYNYRVSRVILFGESATNFARTTLPEKYNITTISNPKFEKISLLKKIKRYLTNGLKY